MKYIAIEGIDYSGKTSLVSRLSEEIAKMPTDKRERVILHQEPTQDNLAGKYLNGNHSLTKDLTLKQKGSVARDLFMIDRAIWYNDVQKLIETKQVRDSDIIITDRSYLSMFAYQSVNFDLSVMSVTTKITFPMKPDLVILLDPSMEVISRRIDESGKYREESKTDIYENIEYLTKVKQNYKDMLMAFKISHIIYTDEMTNEHTHEIVDKIFSDDIYDPNY